VVTLYSAIAANKRKSALLLGIVLSLVVGAVALYTYATGQDWSLPIIAAVLAGGSAVIGYYSGDKIALAVNRAQPVTEAEMPELDNIVENLAIAAGLPKPKIYYINSPALNAFATGRDPAHASIAVTRGLVERLDRSELEGVMAHELAHIRNYDIRYATLVVIFVGFLVILSDLFLRSMLWGGFRDGNKQERNNNQLGIILAVAGVVLLLVAPLIAKLIQLAISRQREFLADSAGALLTRYPEGLARALEKIHEAPILPGASQATAHLFIANPLKGRGWAKLFATHPPLEERIKKLRQW
jgi:heat shock protein HtpX